MLETTKRITFWSFIHRKDENSLGCAIRQFLQKISHRNGDFLDVGFECEVTSIEKLHGCVRVIASEGLCSRRNEERIVLAPDRKQRRRRFAKILLKFRVKLDIRRVV